MKKERILRTALTEAQTGLWYLGQEGFVIGHGAHYLAVDPYLSDYVDQNCSGAVCWKRLYDAPIAADQLDFLDAVLCTHAHADHTDPWTLPKIAEANPNTVFVIPAPKTDVLLSMGIPRERIIPAYADRPIQIGAFRVTPIPSAHEVLHPDENGNCRELGYIIDSEAARILHAGDMCMYDGLTERLTDIDVAILPINGRDYFRTSMNIIGNFDAVEAVTLAKAIGADLLVPVHHDLYEVNRVSPAYFVDVLMRTDPLRKYHIFAPGELYIYAK